MTTRNGTVVRYEPRPLMWHGGVPDTGPGVATESSSAGPHPSATLDRPPALRIRPFGLSDIPRLGRFPGTLRLDVPDSLALLRSGSLDLPAALPFLRRERPAFVASADGQSVGFVRFSPRPPDGRWVLTMIAASTGVFSPEPVWDALLAHGVRMAGLRGVRRLFARAPVGHPLIDAMRHAGWVSYARETVYRADRLTPLTRTVRDLRLQDPADTWAIHQLYAASVPRQVQEIEALTSHVWHMDQPRRTRHGVRQTGWLVEDEGQLTAYARYTRGPKAGMIDAVVRPGRAACLGALLDGAIAESRRGRGRPIYCALRGYLMDLSAELTQRGFVEIGEQELLIRYTTATARTPALDPVLFPVELRPAMPRRVPTFLEGQPMDGTI